ncbi:hypothetical protein HanLR1_Chr00c0033g0695511 [Helianthus annuus]|nr:hypothetical protein HanLR1_Chr00c0033g0695511 [Helianthus annuus]
MDVVYRGASAMTYKVIVDLVENPTRMFMCMELVVESCLYNMMLDGVNLEKDRMMETTGTQRIWVGPATLLSLASGCKQVFLVGDYVHLPAMVISHVAEKFG